MDKKRKENVFHESAIIKGSGSRWVRILERHQMAELLMMSSPHTTKERVSTEFKAAEGEEGATSIYGQNFGATALGSWFPYNITMLKSGSSTGGVDDECGVHRGWLAASRLINTWISLTQPNIAPSLLQVSVALGMLVQLHDIVCSVWLPGAHRCTHLFLLRLNNNYER